MAKKLTRKLESDIERIVRGSVEGAVKHIADDITPNRVKALRYLNGGVDIGAEDGRSKVVATKVRDTIRRTRPSLMRVFMSHEKPVEFIPSGPEDVAAAEQATKYTHYRFRRCGAYSLLRTAFDDAMAMKVGILKAYHVEEKDTAIHTFTGVSEDVLPLLLEDDGIEVIEHTPVPQVEADPATGAPIEMTVHDIKISRTTTKGRIEIVPVPPEEFFVDSEARSDTDFTVIGHRTDKTVGELVAMGLPYDEVCELGSFSSDNDEVVEARNRRSRHREDEDNADPTLRRVTLTEAYMRVDVDGTGIPVLHRFLLAGTGYKLMDYEPVDDHPFAVFQIDPVGHAFFGNSIFDLIWNEQDAATSVLRGVLDNVQMVNSPRFAVLEGMANLDDVMNGEIGAILREKVPSAIRVVDVPFVAGQTLPALQYIDQDVEDKTGVTRASAGLDPDALQSTTRAAVNATLSAAAGQVEVMARNLAEGGLIRLFKILLRLMVQHADREELMHVNGAFVPVDPRVWNVDMDMVPNVGTGTGQDEQKGLVLREVLGFQQGVLQAYGPSNGLVSLTHIRNTIADILALAGYHNADRYIAPMNPQTEQELLAAQQQAQQQAQQGAGDPTSALAQAELQKAQIRAQTDAQKLALQAQVDQAKISTRAAEIGMADDRARDKMLQDLAIAQAKLAAESGVALDVARIKAEQALPRTSGGPV